MFVVKTIAGGHGGHHDGGVEEALFNNPFGVCVDRQKNIYIADSGNHCIRILSKDGRVDTLAGKPGR
jgi:hypothetical protein